jgi:sugar O-acyltransferase (sialic acid O-acetyltransferase NeuD family)
MKSELILIGGGGHCKACIDVIEHTRNYQIAGIVDLPEKLHQKILGYEIIACDDDLSRLINENISFLITIGQIKNPERRVNIFEKLKVSSAKMASIVSPRAYVSRHAHIGEGTIVMHDALINANAQVGRNCIINTRALIEHDAIISDHCHISTGAIVNGGAKVSELSFMGSNSMLKEYIEIGKQSLIGAGARVLKNVSAKSRIN